VAYLSYYQIVLHNELFSWPEQPDVVCINYQFISCSHPFLVNILSLTKEEIKRTKDAKKLLSSINV